MNRTDLLTIGEFARQTGLSLKALRLYDLSGLLAPETVDADTGYRYYGPGQFERARRISLFRRLDMPLAEVARLLDQPGDAAIRDLLDWWNEQERGLTEKRGTVDYLVQSLGGDRTAPSALIVETREVGEQKVATITAHPLQAELLPLLNVSVAGIREHLASAGATFGEEFWVLAHGVVSPDSDGPVEICVPFTGAVGPAPNIVIRIEPAHRQAFTRIGAEVCRYPQILHAYDAVEQWIRRHGESAGPSREIYAYPWDDRPGAGPVADIAAPYTSRR